MISREADATDSLYRPEATDIRPLMKLGIIEPTKWMREHTSDIVYLRDSMKMA
jgi:hypothetical protein